MIPRNLTAAMLALTFTTGVVDAAGYLALHHVFVANMTGNVVLLSLGLLDPGSFPVARPVLALVGFLAGAAAGGRALRGIPDLDDDAPPRRCATLVLVAAGVVGALAVLVGVGAPAPVLDAATAVFAAAMGLQAAVARRIGVADVTTVVVTSTITALASDNRWTGGDAAGRTPRRAGAVLLMLLGALVGAALTLAAAWLAIAVAAVLMGAVGAWLRR